MHLSAFFLLLPLGQKLEWTWRSLSVGRTSSSSRPYPGEVPSACCLTDLQLCEAFVSLWVYGNEATARNAAVSPRQNQFVVVPSRLPPAKLMARRFCSKGIWKCAVLLLPQIKKKLTQKSRWAQAPPSVRMRGLTAEKVSATCCHLIAWSQVSRKLQA